MAGEEWVALTEEVEDLFKRKLQDFAAFAQKEWGVSDAELQERGQSKEWQAGYEAALASLPDAIEFWTEEYPL